ncbi:SMI1/KNR4 family protein [Streptomyces sp. NBC_00690]|uniref:SMI1/KNR4 family protein n=1 Tax=Streptomyces sp. NBC_00690 TaxID=2975808 RepID=UPI002E2E2F68|nr:SMI1/KNR4 family protein [Streptomyces sp. NBC_00690]
MTTIDDLTRLVPPPRSPVAARGDWAQVESALGLALPADFMALVERYGTGQFVDFVTPLNPFGDGSPLLQWSRRILAEESESREEYPEEHPHPYYPEPGGLLMWAGTDNGDRLCWLTQGAPHTWRTVAWNPRGHGWSVHPFGAVAFLHHWLSGETAVQGLLPAPETAQPWFDPFVERVHVNIRLVGPPRDDPDYPERLRILRAALAPTVDRGGVDDGDGIRQDHFDVPERRWKLTYETAYGHQIRLGHPPADEEHARTALLAAVRAMGCTVERVTTRLGEPAWR